jgi:hypothetical protein
LSVFVEDFALGTGQTIPFDEIVELVVLAGSAFTSVIKRSLFGALADMRSLVESLLISTVVFSLVIVM